jgi:hypothetical protein
MRYNKYLVKDHLNLNEEQYWEFIYTIMGEIDEIKADREYKAEQKRFWDSQKPVDENLV